MSTCDFKTRVGPFIPPEYSGFENGSLNERTDQKANYESQNDESAENKNLSWKEIMLAFTQTAGITGVRFIGEKNTVGFRRFLWLVIVLMALSGLLYQTGTLVSSFLSHPSS
ncbi:uncharacterized protein LOC144437478 [Glandiceps talaboti]